MANRVYGNNSKLRSSNARSYSATPVMVGDGRSNSDGPVGMDASIAKAAQGYDKDYSNLKSANSSDLKNMEQGATNNSPASNSSNRDIKSSELNSSYAKPQNFNSKKRDKNKQSNKRFSGFKKKLTIGSLTGLSSLGFLMGIGMIISGPMQLIQWAKYIQDFTHSIVVAQKTLRSIKTTKDLVKTLRTTSDKAKASAASFKEFSSERIRKSRLGYFGNKSVAGIEKRLASQGVTFHSNIFGNHTGISIDISKKSASEVEELKKKYGDLFDKDKAKIEGGKIHFSDNLKRKEIKGIVKDFEALSRFKVVAYMQNRLLLKSIGFTSWLHPFKKLEKKALSKLADFIDSFAKKVSERADNLIDKAAGEVSDEDVGETGDSDNGDAKEKEKKIAEKKEKIKAERIEKLNIASKEASSIGRRIATNALKMLKVGSIVTLITGLACAIIQMSSEIGPYKQEHVINPAMKAAAQNLGYASQVQAFAKTGDDLDINVVGNSVKATLGDDIPVVDENGNSTNEKKFSSAWDATPVCMNLGLPNCDTSDGQTPIALKTATTKDSPARNTPGIGQIMDLAGSLNGWSSQTLCAAVDKIDIVGQGLSWFMDATGMNEKIQEIIAKIPGATRVFASINSWMNGEPLNIKDSTPLEMGAIESYGGHFQSNGMAMASGGKSLSATAQMELKLENRRDLADKFRSKPLLAKLMDPTDYSSSVNQIARAVRLNTSTQDFSTQLANAFKVFTSPVSIMATAFGQLSGNSAYAASAYNYSGAPTFAWDNNEMDQITSDNGPYDLTTNAEKAFDILDHKNPKITADARDYTKRCLAVTIGESPTYDVNNLDNTDGKSWNYPDWRENDEAYCNSLATIMEPVRLYVNDYNIIRSQACYLGDNEDQATKDACGELGFSGNESSNNPTGGADDSGPVNVQGNTDAKKMQQAFFSETGGSYGGYKVSFNGCTTISIWFIKKHTTLKYGRGDGYLVAQNLVSSNPGKLTIKRVPTKAPAIFSVPPGIHGHDPVHGHVGLVTSIDADGTIHTLESGSNYDSTPLKSFTRTYSKAKYTSGGYKFVELDGYTK